MKRLHLSNSLFKILCAAVMAVTLGTGCGGGGGGGGGPVGPQPPGENPTIPGNEPNPGTTPQPPQTTPPGQ